jgi:uncharacterized membrane protein
MIRKKALYKTISWRIVSTLLAFVLSYIYIGSFTEASKFTLVHAIIGSILYYGHEEFYRFLRTKGKI